MRIWILTPMAAIAVAVFSSCAVFKPTPSPEPKEEPKAGTPRLVGRIASIPADKRFVLIQSYGSWNIETGSILTTRGPEERTANLLLTGESLGHFAAADVQSGRVEVGDAVYSHHLPKPTELSTEPEKAIQLPEHQTNTSVNGTQ